MTDLSSTPIPQGGLAELAALVHRDLALLDLAEAAPWTRTPAGVRSQEGALCNARASARSRCSGVAETTSPTRRRRSLGSSSGSAVPGGSTPPMIGAAAHGRRNASASASRRAASAGGWFKSSPREFCRSGP